MACLAPSTPPFQGRHGWGHMDAEWTARLAQARLQLVKAAVPCCSSDSACAAIMGDVSICIAARCAVVSMPLATQRFHSFRGRSLRKLVLLCPPEQERARSVAQLHIRRNPGSGDYREVTLTVENCTIKSTCNVDAQWKTYHPSSSCQTLSSVGVRVCERRSEAKFAFCCTLLRRARSILVVVHL